MSEVAHPAIEHAGEPDRERIVGWIRWLTILMGIVGIFLSMNQVFNWNFFGVMEIFGVDLIIDTSFFYIMLGIFFRKLSTDQMCQHIVIFYQVSYEIVSTFLSETSKL